MKRLLMILGLALLVGGIFPAAAQSEPLRVVATTTIIADVARQVGGDYVTVDALVPPNSDVHAFQPTPADVVKVAQADVVLVNGAGLEAFLGGLLENVAGVAPVVVSDGVNMLPFGDHEHDEAETTEEEEHLGLLGDEGVCEDVHHADESPDADGHDHGSCDPHVWTDPANVMIWAENIAVAFAAADPAHATEYEDNAVAYEAELETLDSDVRDILAGVPQDRRVLVTNHEFMSYFAHTFGFEVVGVVLPGGSTLAEPTPQDLAALIQTIQAENIPAIFIEASSSSTLADVVAGETGVAVVTSLYSGSLSDADGPASTYLDYMRYNAQTIADALGG
ncbi:MAG: zinc ABC transporter substrate-binding protein [Anaerolineaceae bacterium]|nr:zinc ABC transporter substrate-binding protein [Anaerolineaceae bacterium]